MSTETVAAKSAAARKLLRKELDWDEIVCQLF